MLEEAGKQLPSGLPEGVLYPDGSGGLRVEFRTKIGTSEERYVLLNVHQDLSQQDFIYWQEGSNPGELRTAPSIFDLSERLDWLTR